MAIDIEWQIMPPQKNASDSKPHLFPRILNTEVTDSTELAKRLAAHNGLSKGAVESVLEDLGDIMASLLAEGKEISIPSLGRFRLSVGTDLPVTPATPLNTRAVSVRGIRFQPAEALLQSVGKPVFRLVARNATPIAPSSADLIARLSLFMQSHPSFTSTEFAQHFHLKRSTAFYRLNELIKKGLIRREGYGTDIKYTKGETEMP